ncbi:MAG: hypothetical protein MUE30_06995, partial [Spirosomaceae bacterium]|nr:hypothetical protein [Spirosomataceae bacterium]
KNNFISTPMTLITIEPKNKADYELFISLAKRLKAKYTEQPFAEKEPTKEEILRQLGEDYRALQNGTLQTRPLKDLLDEL